MNIEDHAQAGIPLGKALADCLGRIGMTGQEAAVKIGVSQPTVSNWLSGKVEVGSMNSGKVRHFLGQFQWAGVTPPILVTIRPTTKPAKSRAMMAQQTQRVTKRTHINLGWQPKPKVFWLVPELINSDAYRELSKFESDLLLFVMTLREYPSNKKLKKGKGLSRDYWNPLNGHEITIPMVAVADFFNRKDMRRTAPNSSTITRAMNKLMQVGFLSCVHVGGSGKGDMSKYRLENNWRIWKKGDPPCFSKAGLSRVKGFCVPGSGKFYRSVCNTKTIKGGNAA
ncbi:MAG: helix-turn-helix domain-containing protein [Proteobacteria bacterium]|nr:helix-turn-helix domain-containing protein [Pseudomonadota bacterium]MBU0968580.1 helix-turn-helix domain-containing protein [Pseudomonadota bacterium]